MRHILFLLIFSVSSNAYATRVLQEKETGKLLEYQSDARPGTLLKNYTDNPQYGYTQDQIEEKEVSFSEWTEIRKKWIDQPAENSREEKRNARKPGEDALKQKLNLTDQEFNILKESLRN